MSDEHVFYTAVKPHTDSFFLHFSKRHIKILTVQYLHTVITPCHIMSCTDKSANAGTKAKSSFFGEFTLVSITNFANYLASFKTIRNCKDSYIVI